MSRSLALLLRRVVARTGSGPLGPLWRLLYEATELREAAAGSALVADGPVLLGDVAADEAGPRKRPRVGHATADWRLVARPERRPPRRDQDRQEARIAAWLELQFIWRGTFTACVNPGAPYVPYLCVKLVADPVRVWMWLAHGE